jgi:hypothetical protein
MSYETKMSALEAILADHNKVVGVNKGWVDIDIQEIKNKLLHLGATSEVALSQCSFEDLESCGIPRLLAKTVAQVFRNGPEPEKPQREGWVSDRIAERMGYEELIARYNPLHENAIWKRLEKDSQRLHFIVFTQGNQVDQATTLKLLQEIKQGFGERPIGGIVVDGTMKQIYKVGEKPDNLVDENPLYPGRALRPDGTCDQLNRSWEGVQLSTRQLIYLAVKETKEFNLTLGGAHDILDIALKDTSSVFEFTGRRCPKAQMLWVQKDKQGNLPLLKIELGKQTNKPQLNPRVTIIS